MRAFFCWYSEIESRSFAWLRLRPNVAPVAFYNLLADSKADTRAWVFASVQALEEAEYLFGMLRINTDAVISD